MNNVITPKYSSSGRALVAHVNGSKNIINMSVDNSPFLKSRKFK